MYSSIFPVHKLRQTELTKDSRSKWRLWPLRPAVSCTGDGADWPKVVAVGAQQPISDFFGFIQIRDTLSTNGEHHRVAEVKSFPAIPKSMRSVNGEQNGANLKKWSVLLVCTISGAQSLVKFLSNARTHCQMSISENFSIWSTYSDYLSIEIRRQNTGSRQCCKETVKGLHSNRSHHLTDRKKKIDINRISVRSQILPRKKARNTFVHLTCIVSMTVNGVIIESCLIFQKENRHPESNNLYIQGTFWLKKSSKQFWSVHSSYRNTTCRK